MPRRLSDQHIAAVIGLLDRRADADWSPAAHVETGGRNWRILVVRRAAWEVAATDSANAVDLRALVLPLAVLNPKSRAVPVLNIEGVDVHIAL